MFASARLVAFAACAVALAACGSGASMVVASRDATSTTAPTTATTAPATTETLTVPTTFHDPPVPKPVKPVRGPGRLLGPVLLFHIDGGVPDYYNPSYWAAFRTVGRFTKQLKNGDGKHFPGAIWIGDSEDDYKGFFEGFHYNGPGITRGRCFVWGVTATALLKGKKTGDPVPITFEPFRTTGVQRRIAHLQVVGSSPTRSVRRAFARLGCEPWYFGDDLG
jgi:hypothetical protein